MKNLKTIRIEGGIFSPDLLEQLEAEELQGQKPKDFQFKDKNEMINAVAAIFSETRDLWARFQRRRANLPDSESDTTLTRQWIIELLHLLEYRLEFNRAAYQIGNTQFRISHRAGDSAFAPPVHIVGASQALDSMDASAQPRRSPHSMLQEFLNRTDALWGIVTNGVTLRVLRDCSHIRKLSYLEFDLNALLEEQQFDSFMLLYRLLHRSRLPQAEEDAHQSLLERYYQQAIEQGGRVREKLRDGVEQAIIQLANGFLAQGTWALEGSTLKLNVSGEWITVAESERHFYQQLLKLIYRLLFLLVAEERGLISPSALYQRHYGVARLRPLVNQRRAQTRHTDLWHSLRALWHILRKPELAETLHATALNGGLFNEQPLDLASINNRDLLGALKHMVYYEGDDRSLRVVNYGALDVEELGSVYESLLEMQPLLIQEASANRVRFEYQRSQERKSTGSYYTPAELVAELINSALTPVIQQRLRAAQPKEAENALLSIKVLDPACGSGHFLLAAARELGRELAKIRSIEADPSPVQIRDAARDVISHCIYGVDKNPLAVELCRVALWIESHTAGKPLTYLDHHIRCGDSLVGVLDMYALDDGIPDEAYEPVAGDDKTLARSIKRINRSEREGQSTLQFNSQEPSDEWARGFEWLQALPDNTPEQVWQKEKAYQDLQTNRSYQRVKNACNLWTAAFFAQINRQNVNPNRIPTTGALWRYLYEERAEPAMMGYVDFLARRHQFFHWQLEFPEVFAKGGFDVVMANPPWEKIKLEQKEFFSARAPQIAQAPNAASRRKMIERLHETDTSLYQEYRDAIHDAECLSKFLRKSKRFLYTARGEINTYSVFAELFTCLIRGDGRAGVVVPTGIAIDDANKHFFAHLNSEQRLVNLCDFENRAKLFPSVDSRTKFCLLTVSGKPVPNADFAFFLHRAADLKDERRRFQLSSEDLELLNPNTRTCPVFRSRDDAELTKKIYRAVPVLMNECKDENPWSARFLRMFDMANDSHLFRTNPGEGLLPLYEAKMFWQYDHRYGSYEGVSDRNSTHLPTPTAEQYADPTHKIKPWYWVPEYEVEQRLGDWNRGWLIGFRGITNATNERTCIFSLMPRVGVGNNAPILLSDQENDSLLACLYANFSSLVFDYLARQKVGGNNLNFFILKQLPVLPPSAYSQADIDFILPRVLELVYTAWDMKPFAEDIWREAGGAPFGAQGKAHGGTSVPPPFRWDAERRAVLKAELDAYFARLYGLTRDELRYILDPQEVYGEDFPGETFRVLKEKEIKQFGEYRTRRLVLEAWDHLP